MERVADCLTCKWNFPPQGGKESNLCANVYYGALIKDIQREGRFCDDWGISLEEFVKRKKLN